MFTEDAPSFDGRYYRIHEARNVPPPVQPHVPPQPSLPPQVPFWGQLGVQQLPPYSTEPLAQPQVLPQPSDIPARLPFVGQFGVQQAPM